MVGNTKGDSFKSIDKEEVAKNALLMTSDSDEAMESDGELRL
jgi:hypothetical protein